MSPNQQIKAESVLIVEDEGIIAAEIEMILRDLGYRIAGRAKNGLQALDLLASTSPDIALLDIDLRGKISGIEVAEVIQDKYAIPFIFLTALADAATLERVKRTMPYGYIVKPFNENDLRTAIELALYRFRMQQPQQLPSQDDLNQQLLSPLTTREYEVLVLLEEGLTYKQIGERLFISYNTVKTYQKALFAKLQVSSRHQMSQVLKNGGPTNTT